MNVDVGGGRERGLRHWHSPQMFEAERKRDLAYSFIRSRCEVLETLDSYRARFVNRHPSNPPFQHQSAYV